MSYTVVIWLPFSFIYFIFLCVYSDGSMLFFPARPNRHQLRKAQQKMKRDCMQNRDPAINQPFIPRTQRLPPKDQVQFDFYLFETRPRFAGLMIEQFVVLF